MSPITEDELRARLRGVEPSPAHPGFADHLIHQGRFRRRRQRWVTGIAAAAAVAVIGGGALVLGDQLGRETALPATPTPMPTLSQVSPTVTTSPSPTHSPSTSTTSQPGPLPSGSPSSSSTPSRSVSLKPVTFLHQDVKHDPDSDTERDWVPSTRVLGPCDTNAWAIAGDQNEAVERRAISGGGLDGGPRDEALFVFPDAAAAVAFMGQLRELTRNCMVATDGRNRGLVETLPGPWGEGLAYTYIPNHPQSGQTIAAGAPVGLAVRSGRSVAMATSAGPFPLADQVDPGMITSTLPGVEHLYPQLCRYTVAGC